MTNKIDPTRTLTLRSNFARKMRTRFDALVRLIVKAIVEKDVFGLIDKSINTLSVSDMFLPPNKAFNYTTSQDKIKAFMDWLDEMVRTGILEISTIPGATQLSIEEAWTDIYILSAYQRGIARAYSELRKAGYDVPSIESQGGMSVVFNQPFHIERVGLLYTRVFQNLKGITAEMDTQISRVLAQGMAEGKGPREIARLMRKVITGVGDDLSLTDTLGRYIPAKRRAEMLARTEIIRAHHQASIQTYRSWGVHGVDVEAEWVTAGFSVCPDCEEMEANSPYTLDEIEFMIPLHPMCRCVAIPVAKN